MTLQEKREQGKRVSSKTLADNVMAVAVEGTVKDWACYIGAVTGLQGEELVYAAGYKQSEEIARAIFPAFHDLIYRR
ncbi:hypothetical protein ES703_91029 [subsurface metagenome]